MRRDYEAIAARFWNLPSKGEEEANREQLFMDDIIQKAHLDREIAARLDDVTTVLDAGGGAGRFSIPLAQRGLSVTHLDISRPMIEKARLLAAQAGVQERITFVEGRLTELSHYPDGAFDLVISFDAPISYCWPEQGQVLRELVRIARRAVVVSVVSRYDGIAMAFNPAQKERFLVDEAATDPILRWYPKLTPELVAGWAPDYGRVDSLRQTGLFEEPDRVYEQMAAGGAPWPVTYGFQPGELEAALQAAGLSDVRLAGAGALAKTLPGPVLRKLLFTPEHRERFLDQCYRFDSQPWVAGLGALVASGVKA